MRYQTLFVYGTLKRGYQLHTHWMRDARLVGTAHTVSSTWQMLQQKGRFYPFVTDFGKNHIGGEVYDVPEFLYTAIAQMEKYAGYDVCDEQVVLENGDLVMTKMFYMPTLPENIQAMGFTPNSQNIVSF